MSVLYLEALLDIKNVNSSVVTGTLQIIKNRWRLVAPLGKDDILFYLREQKLMSRLCKYERGCSAVVFETVLRPRLASLLPGRNVGIAVCINVSINKVGEYF